MFLNFHKKHKTCFFIYALYEEGHGRIAAGILDPAVYTNSIYLLIFISNHEYGRYILIYIFIHQKF